MYRHVDMYGHVARVQDGRKQMQYVVGGYSLVLRTSIYTCVQDVYRHVARVRDRVPVGRSGGKHHDRGMGVAFVCAPVRKTPRVHKPWRFALPSRPSPSGDDRE